MDKWPRLDIPFQFNDNSTEAAHLLSEGKTVKVVAELVGISTCTINLYKTHPDFLAYVDKCTMAHENGTLAGLLRLAYQAVLVKGESLADDKSTMLDFMKFIESVSPNVAVKETKQEIKIVVE